MLSTSYSETPYLSIEAVTETLSKREMHKSTENMWSFPIIRGTKNPKEVWVNIAVFWRRIGTTPLEVFFVFFAALYYGKINLSCPKPKKRE